MQLSNSRIPVFLVAVLAFSASEAQQPDGPTSADSAAQAPLLRFDRVVYLEDEAATSANVNVAFGDDEGDAYGIAIGDLDNDGRPDIAVARSEGRDVVYSADVASTSAP